MGIRGGYESREIGGGTISIHVRGNGYTDAGTVLEYAYRRATELCGQFDVVDRDGSTSTQYQRSGDTVSEVNRHEITMLVRCRQQ
jgi:hypothetical protein